MNKWDKICGIRGSAGAAGVLQLRSMYQASLPYWYFQMVWPMEQTSEMASRQPNNTRIWKLVMRSTLDSFSGGRVEFWATSDDKVVWKGSGTRCRLMSEAVVAAARPPPTLQHVEQQIQGTIEQVLPAWAWCRVRCRPPRRAPTECSWVGLLSAGSGLVPVGWCCRRKRHWVRALLATLHKGRTRSDKVLVIVVHPFFYCQSWPTRTDKIAWTSRFQSQGSLFTCALDNLLAVVFTHNLQEALPTSCVNMITMTLH